LSRKRRGAIGAQYYADGEYDDMLAARKRKAGGEA